MSALRPTRLSASELIGRRQFCLGCISVGERPAEGGVLGGQKQYAGGEAFEYSERITWRKVLPLLHRSQTSRRLGPDAGPQQPHQSEHMPCTVALLEMLSVYCLAAVHRGALLA